MLTRCFTQVFKFACYLSIPVGMVYLIAGKPDTLEAVIKNARTSFSLHCLLHVAVSEVVSILQRSYVVYPPEGPRPPTAEQMAEIMRKREQQQEQ